MNSNAKTVEEYIDGLPPERRAAVERLREVLRENLPEGFAEEISYGMIGYVVPHDRYPSGYHVDPSLPLPFINLASQKNYIAIYHSGLYADEDLRDWFTAEYAKRSDTRLDMGKSCIRFRKPGKIPYELMGELARRMSPDEWIELYEKSRGGKH